MFMNRKERRKIAKKIHTKSSNKELMSWKAKKNEIKQIKEKELMEYLESRKKTNDIGEVENNQASSTSTEVGNQNKPYSLHIALPGSILNNSQSPELRTYLVGQVARAAAVFCVEEIIIFDETARMTQGQIDAYYSGRWTGNENCSERNTECNFIMARILEFLECPQYLRKTLFPLQRPLKFAGILNPLDGMHHLRSTNLDIPYREGVVMDKPIKQGHGSMCDVGLEKELELESVVLPPKTRVTVKITRIPQNAKRYRGVLTSPNIIKKEKYDVVIGTSEKGTPLKDSDISASENCKILIVFGGLDGIESALDADEEISTNDPTEFFPIYVNVVPDQGSRIIRTEEAIPISLSLIKAHLD